MMIDDVEYYIFVISCRLSQHGIDGPPIAQPKQDPGLVGGAEQLMNCRYARP